MAGIPQKEHLKEIEPDQSVVGIDTLDDTARNDARRKWFVSQAIQPVVIQGYYNEDTGRYVLGDWRNTMTPNSSWTTTSAAALTLTCAAGHRYRVYYASARNASQATAVTLSGVINGNAVGAFNENCVLTATTRIICLGGQGVAIDAIAGSYGANGPREIWLNAGDTLTMTLSAYAGGNDTEHLFMFEDYTV